MNSMIFWLGSLVLLLIIEAATMGLTTIWFAGGALTALIAALCQVPFGWQVTLFFVVSFVLLFFTRPLALSYFNKEREKTNLDSIIGAKAVVQTQINNLEAKGQVKLGGQEWSARSREQEIISPGEVVRIVEIRGVKLIVEKIEEQKGEA